MKIDRNCRNYKNRLKSIKQAKIGLKHEKYEKAFKMLKNGNISFIRFTQIFSIISQRTDVHFSKTKRSNKNRKIF